jgi:hypothetical protein
LITSSFTQQPTLTFKAEFITGICETLVAFVATPFGPATIPDIQQCFSEYDSNLPP